MYPPPNPQDPQQGGPVAPTGYEATPWQQGPQQVPPQQFYQQPYAQPQQHQPQQQQPWINPSQNQQFNQPPNKQNKQLLWIVGGVGIGCISILTIFGVLVIGSLMYIGYTAPPTEVMAWNNVEAHHKKMINKLGVVPADDTILYVYSDGFSYDAACYILTDKTMIIHTTDGTDQIKLSDIEYVEPYFGSGWDDGWVWITLFNEDSYGFPISAENGADQKMVERLRTISGAKTYDEDAELEQLDLPGSEFSN